MKKTLKEKVFVDFANVPLTGACLMNVPMVVKLWQDHWFISQYHDEYRFCESKKFKVTISRSQAVEIIRGLRLLASQSPVFNYGLTWKTISTHQSDMEKMKSQNEKK